MKSEIRYQDDLIKFFITAITAEDYYHLYAAVYTHSEYNTSFADLLETVGDIWFDLSIAVIDDGRVECVILFSREDKDTAMKIISTLKETLHL